jgi:glutamine synthetase
MRFIDGTANPYLALAAIIGAGVSGLKTTKSLKIQDCQGPRCAFEMTEEERRALGITKRMPLNIEEARKNLTANQDMKHILGETFVEKYISVNEVGNFRFLF